MLHITVRNISSSLFFLGLLFIVQCAWSVEYTITQLTDNNTDDSSPQVNNSGTVVWSGNDGNDSDIFIYNGSMSTQLTDDDYPDNHPKISNIGTVVWSGHDGNDYEIFLYDGLNVSQLTDNSNDDLSLQIYAGITYDLGWIENVVWSGHDGNDYEIFHYDTSKISQLTHNSYHDDFPQLNVNRQNVVWSGYDGNDYEIFYYDGNYARQLTDNNTDDISPQIIKEETWNWDGGSNNSTVVWSGYDGNDYEIFVSENLRTRQLTDNSTDDISPQIINNAEWNWSYKPFSVVWSGHDGNDYEIFLYNGSTTRKLTENNIDDHSPKISVNGSILWSGNDGNDEDIFLYYGDVINLTNNDTDDLTPQFNDQGDVVWSGFDSDNDSEIFLASPKYVTAPILDIPEPHIKVVASGDYTKVPYSEVRVTGMFMPLKIRLDNPAEPPKFFVEILGAAYFPVGTTVLRWTASDAHGNETTKTQTITVEPNPNAIVLTNTPKTIAITKKSVVIGWKTNIKSDSYVIYGTSPELNIKNGYERISESVSATQHNVTINGLEAGQIYYYRVVSMTPDYFVVSDEMSFTVRK